MPTMGGTLICEASSIKEAEKVNRTECVDDESSPAAESSAHGTTHEQEEKKVLAFATANAVPFDSNDQFVEVDCRDDKAIVFPEEKHTSNRKRRRKNASEDFINKESANETSARTRNSKDTEDDLESEETQQAPIYRGEVDVSDGSSEDSGSSASDDNELSLDEEGSEDEDTQKKTDNSTAFGRAFQKIMKRKLPASALGEAMGPILSAHKQLVAKKLEEAAEGQKAKRESKKEKQALREKGHIVPALYSTAKDKELIKLATRGVVKLFNAVSKAQSVQEAAKGTRTVEAKEVAKRRKSTFLAMLQGGDGSTINMQKQSTNDKKEGMAERQPSWVALQDTFMLGKTRLKDWDKKQDEEPGAGGMRDISDDSGSD